jgi:hypothetical protein
VDPALANAAFTNFSFASRAALGETVGTAVLGLAAGTSYYYRMEAVLSGGETIRGEIHSFPTVGNREGTLIVQTLPPSFGADGSVIFRGRLNPAGLPPQYWFEYAHSPSMAFSIATPFQSAGNISGYIDVLRPAPELSFGHAYYYRLAAQTLWGTMYGEVVQVTPSPAAFFYPAPAHPPVIQKKAPPSQALASPPAPKTAAKEQYPLSSPPLPPVQIQKIEKEPVPPPAVFAKTSNGEEREANLASLFSAFVYFTKFAFFIALAAALGIVLVFFTRPRRRIKEKKTAAELGKLGSLRIVD